MSPRRPAVLRDGGGTQDLREYLIGTAERLIAEQGTAALTVRAIARAAGVADGVLYNHFADKEELLAHALRAHVRSVEAGLGALPEAGTGSVPENLRAHIAYGLALHRAILPAFAGLLARPAVLTGFAGLAEPGGEWRDRLTGYLRAERALGRLAADAEVDAAAAMIVGVCHETVLTALFHGAATPPEAPERSGPPTADGTGAADRPGAADGTEDTAGAGDAAGADRTGGTRGTERADGAVDPAGTVDRLVRAVLQGIGHRPGTVREPAAETGA
ncbi:TetR/AcrR family transcriptional regulator [Streptomyces sp. NPDC018031]|uniref:TetR/AcrR family transcriptional regulator n=1 Tax=Streptomyces sp. NPDC018031 TaxID=3365033 RepID=UPI0037963CC0